MIAPSMEIAKEYCDVVGDDKKFEIDYEGIKEWFEEEFTYLETEKKQLTKAFLMHLKWEYEKKLGVKSETDIDASVTYDTGFPGEIQAIYDRYKKVNVEPKKRGLVIFND